MYKTLPDLSHIPNRDAEMMFFVAHRPEWSRDHPREWVAVVGQEVVGVGLDLGDVLRQAREKGHPYPFVGALFDPELAEAEFMGLH